jgi:hypothetical protein
MKLRKTIGILLLSFWIPFILAMAFADQYGNSGWYMVAGLIMVVFGTWGGILLVTSKK